MATNQTGIAITIKAFLPIGKNLDRQLAALTLVKTAHETSDYAALLGAARIDEVKTEQKTRRVAETPAAPDANDPDFAEVEGVGTETAVDPIHDPAPTAPIDDAEIPDFLKSKSKKKAA